MSSKIDIEKHSISEEKGQELLIKYRVLTKLVKEKPPKPKEVPFILRHKIMLTSTLFFLLLFIASQITISKYLKNIQKKNSLIYNLGKQVKKCSELLDDRKFHEFFPLVSKSILLANQLSVEYSNNQDINKKWAKLVVLKFYGQTVRYIRDQTGYIKKPSILSIYTYDRINSIYPKYSEILSMINYFTELTELQKQYSQNPYNDTRAIKKASLVRAKVILKMLKKNLSDNITTIKVDFSQFYSYLRLTLDGIDDDLGIWESFWNTYVKSYFMDKKNKEKTIANLENLFPNLQILKEINDVNSLSIGYWSFTYYPPNFWNEISDLFEKNNISVEFKKYENIHDLIDGWLDQAFDICIIEPYYSYDLFSSSEDTGISFYNLTTHETTDFYIVTHLNKNEFKHRHDLKLLINPTSEFKEFVDIMSLPKNSEFHNLKYGIADIDYETDPEIILKKIENKLNDFALMRKPVFDSQNNYNLNTIPIITKNKDYVVFSAILLSEKKKELIKKILIDGDMNFSPFSYTQLDNYYKEFQPSPTFDANRIFIDSKLPPNDKRRLIHLLLQCGLTPSFKKTNNTINPLYCIEADLIKIKQNTENPFLFIEFTVKDKGEKSVFRTDVFKWNDSDLIDNVYYTLSEIGLYSTIIEADPGTIISRRAIYFEMPENTLVEFYKIDYSIDYSDSVKINENAIKIGVGKVITSYKNLFVAKILDSDTKISKYNLVRIKK